MMKNYKKGILATLVVATMPLIAATSDDTIKVTTFADEDGENANACSLREAIETAKDVRLMVVVQFLISYPLLQNRFSLKKGLMC
jgi:CSLREA domain-containing protein